MCRNSIWTIGILAMFLLSGCATSTQDLIEQAQLTGDWSFVNKRMATLERLKPQHPQSCPRGTKRWCMNSPGHEKCSCVSASEGLDMFDALGL